MNKQKIIIIGAGGFANEVLSFIQEDDEKEFIRFIDKEDEYLLEGLIKPSEDLGVVIAIGDHNIREKIYLKLKKLGYNFPNIIHPSAYVSCSIKIGEGNIIYPGVVINAQCNIGNCVLLNSNCSIGHNCVIDDYVNVNPNSAIAGFVNLKKGCYIGIGGIVLQGLTIEENALVGGGAVVTKDVSAGYKVVGIPARRIK